MVTSEALTRMELFEDLPEGVLNCLTDLCSAEAFCEGTIIFAAGRRADRIYLLDEGTVDLLVYPTSLPEPMTIARLKTPGQTFGWSAVVGSGYYTASAQATTDVRAIALEGRALVECLEDNPCEGFIVLRRIAQVVSNRLATIRTLLLETVCD